MRRRHPSSQCASASASPVRSCSGRRRRLIVLVLLLLVLLLLLWLFLLLLLVSFLPFCCFFRCCFCCCFCLLPGPRLLLTHCLFTASSLRICCFSGLLCLLTINTVFEVGRIFVLHSSRLSVCARGASPDCVGLSCVALRLHILCLCLLLLLMHLLRLPLLCMFCFRSFCLS